MSSWKEIMESSEAKLIRESAETAYKRRRRVNGVRKIYGSGSQPVDLPATKLTALVQSVRMDNVGLDTSHSSTFFDLRPDINLIIAFVNVIFPAKLGFPGLSGTADLRWLYRSLLVVEPMYLAFRLSGYSRVRKGKLNEISDINADAETLQMGALQSLQRCVAELHDGSYSGTKLFRRGIRALAIMTQLVSLEVHSYVEGQWELHLEAARIIMGMFQNNWAPGLFVKETTEPGESGLENTEEQTERVSTDDPRTLEFFFASFVWVDIIANATYGPPPFNPQHFNYLPLLANGSFQPQSMIGCQSCIMTIMTQITAIEAWKGAQLELGCLSVVELVNRATSLSDRITYGIQGIDTRLSDNSIGVTEADSGAVNRIFAYASLVYLHTIVSGSSPHTPEIKQNVIRCLENLEVIPAHLFVRNCWPLTIAGSMATEDLYERFRGVVTQTAEADHILGSTWKALEVIEECWRLRKCQSGIWDWRSTMKRMNIKILLI